MTDRPAVRLGPDVLLDRRGCQIVAAALEFATRAAAARNGGGGIDPDVAWVHEVVRLAAEPPRPPDAASGNGGEPWRLDMPGSDPIWSTAEAAAFLRVTPRAVVAAIGRGELAAERAGRRAWVLRQIDVRQYAGRDGRSRGARGRRMAGVPARPDDPGHRAAARA